MVVVVDGLGHGPGAESAASTALSAIRSAPALGAVDTLFNCDRALRGTRGAGASVLVIGRRSATFAGVGNVEARVISARGETRLVPDRGVLGRGIRPPRPLEVSLDEAWLALVHTDGVSSRLNSPPLDPRLDLDASARAILETWARPTDDATVVLAMNGSPDM